MDSVGVKTLLDKLPIKELEQELEEFVAPLVRLLPDRRLRRVVVFGVRGILARESPVITQLAQSVARDEAGVWAAAKRLYRLMYNQRVSSKLWFEGLYQVARATVQAQEPEYLVVALDPVNLEKPYTKKLEGVSTVHKSTPPHKEGKARLAVGYPASTATIVNTLVPATTYADWFSYTKDFISEHWQLQQAITNTCKLLGER